MNNMNCVSTMPEIMPEITDEAIIEALFAQRPYEEPKKKPRYYKLIANVLVNGKIERRYGRFDFDPTELKNARARNAAANAAAG